MSSVSQCAETSMSNKVLTQDHPVPSKLCMQAQSVSQNPVEKCLTGFRRPFGLSSQRYNLAQRGDRAVVRTEIKINTAALQHNKTC